MSVSTYQPFNLKAWLRLMRWPNLLIVGGTQTVAWWCVIHPLPGPKVLSPLNFLLLCGSTMLIAAGGYIINDYFDIRIDAINKPDKVILERDIPRRLAIIVHSALNVVALGLAAMVALPAGHPEWLLLQLATTGMLWRYSTTWKRQFVIGNVVVALMTALTIIVLIIYESALRRGGLQYQPSGWFGTGKVNPLAILVIFSCFAFLLTWMREIVKDMEDYKGDDAEGCVTMPIKLGLQSSTRFAQRIGAFAATLLVSAATILIVLGRGWNCSGYWLLFCLVFPLLRWMFTLPKAATSAHYHSASTALKWLMVMGIWSFFLLSLFNYA